MTCLPCVPATVCIPDDSHWAGTDCCVTGGSGGGGGGGGGGAYDNIAITNSSFATGTITGSTWTGGTLTGPTIASPTITSPTISGPTVSGGTFSGSVFSSPTITNPVISGGSISGTSVTGLPTPSLGSDAATKSYVDALAGSGLQIKTPVVATTTGSNVTLAGGAPNTLDGYTLHAADRILVKDQTAPAENGIYTVTTLGSGANGTWARATDCDASSEFILAYVFINNGTALGGSAWVCTTAAPITVGTTAITWTLFSQLASVPASRITGTIIDTQIADLAINTAKFAASIKPVEIVSSLPNTALVQGRIVFLTTDNKLYRYTGSAWTTVVQSVDVSGQFGPTSIEDAAITAAKLSSNSVVASKIAAGAIVAGKIAADAVTATEILAGSITTPKLAAGAVTANELAANSVIAGKVAAAAISTTELAVGAVAETRIADGAISTRTVAASAIIASKISVSQLSAISADCGTLTAGSITSNCTLDVGSTYNRIHVTTSGIDVGNGALQINSYGGGNGSQLWVNGGTRGVRIYAQNAAIAAIQVIDGTGAVVFATNDTGSIAAKSILLTDPASNTLAYASSGLILSGASSSSSRISNTGGFNATSSTGSVVAGFQAKQNGDSYPRVALWTDGSAIWSPGSGGADITMSRTATGVLNIDKALTCAGYVKVTGAAVVPSGTGMELLYDSGTTTAKINSYDRGASAYRDLALQAATIKFGELTSHLVDFIAGADGTSPSNTAAPAAWIKVKRNGSTGWIPWYQ